MRAMSSPKSLTVSNFLLMTFPYYEGILLLAIVVSGLNKVDLYHVLCLFIFVAFLNNPKKKFEITIFTINYAFIFIFMKYIYSLLIYVPGLIERGSNTSKILKVIGIASEIKVVTEFERFEYQFKPQQWLLLLIGYV